MFTLIKYMKSGKFLETCQINKINKTHKIWQVSRKLPDFMYFINVNILGS